MCYWIKKTFAFTPKSGLEVFDYLIICTFTHFLNITTNLELGHFNLYTSYA